MCSIVQRTFFSRNEWECHCSCSLQSCVFDLHLSPVNCSFITSFIRAIANPCLLGQEPGYMASASIISSLTNSIKCVTLLMAVAMACLLAYILVSCIIYNNNDSICTCLLEWMCSLCWNKVPYDVSNRPIITQFHYVKAVWGRCALYRPRNKYKNWNIHLTLYAFGRNLRHGFIIHSVSKAWTKYAVNK